MLSLYWVVKLLKEHNELRYHRLTNVLTSLAKVTFEDTFLVKAWIQTSMSETILYQTVFSCPIRTIREDSLRKFVSDVRIHSKRHIFWNILDKFFFRFTSFAFSDLAILYLCVRERHLPFSRLNLRWFNFQITSRVNMITSEYGMVGGGVNNKSWFWWHCADITRRESLCWCCINSWGTWYYNDILRGASECFMALLGAKELQCAHETIVIPKKNITYCTYDWCNERLARYSRKWKTNFISC